jgi:hypothetical protein
VWSENYHFKEKALWTIIQDSSSVIFKLLICLFEISWKFVLIVNIVYYNFKVLDDIYWKRGTF